MAPSRVSLKEWIHRALTSIESRKTSSPLHSDTSTWQPSVERPEILLDDFLLPALKVACSLASQLCNADGPGERSNGSYNEGPSQSPTNDRLPLGPDWSDHVVVFYNAPSKDARAGSISPARLESNDESQQRRFSNNNPPLQELASIDSNVDFSPCTTLPDEEEEKKLNDRGPIRNNATYLDVQRAEILGWSNENETMNSGHLGEEEGRLYSLGLVFYELFSGGRRPPELEPASGVHQSDDMFNPLSVDETDSIDLTSALQILDDLGDDDESFRGFNGRAEPEVEPNRIKKSRSSQNNLNQNPRGKLKMISVEPLKLQRIPTALCDLIGNMIDSANGDFRGDECYSQMSDVLADLKLMSEKPDKFLHDQDISKLAMSSLQLDECMFGRESEFSSLLSAYHRSVAGKNEMAFIVGPSGTGKSFLANRLAEVVSQNGGIFLSGKFDLQKQAKPFSAIATAFNEYCDFLVENEDPDEIDAVACALERSLDQEIHHLMKVIPNLSKIVGHDGRLDNYGVQHECVDAQRRLQYLLCRFVKEISSFSSVPITLFLDDLQWADMASINVINQLLLNSGSANQVRNFFFLGCYRDDEMYEGHPVLTMISGAQSFQVSLTRIVLGCMPKEVINAMISDLLCLSPRLTKSLSEIIYRKTKGNPLFFSNLMLSLCKDGILRVNLARLRWEWDEEMIQSRELPDDVASFFTGKLGKLPEEVRTAMSVLACFGASTDYTLIKVLEEKLGFQILAPLEVAVAEGFLVKVGGDYCFSHDRVQESAYRMIDPSLRQPKHFEYGLALSEGLDSPFLFTSVGQLNRGGPSSVRDSSQGAKIANLNLVAGCKAIEMSDFTSSFYFFENGISFLGNNHWVQYYDLSLKLFEGAAKCALVNANFESLESLSQQVMTNARSFEDQLNTIYVSMIAFSYSSTHSELVEKGISILKKLDIKLPRTDLNCHMDETRLMLSQHTTDELLNYHLMEDHSKIMAMKFMSRIQMPLIFMKSDLQPFVTLKMVQLSLLHGLSPMSPLGFAYYGGLLAQCGYVKEGYMVGKLAKRLVDRVGLKEVAGEVYVITTVAALAVEPMQAVDESFLQGYNIALSVGDMDQAIMNMRMYATTQFWIGTKLQIVKERIAQVCNLMRRHNHLTWTVNLKPMQRTVSSLIDEDSNESALTSGHAEHIYFHLMLVAFIFRRFDEMKLHAEKYFQSKKKLGILSVFDALFNFFDGLVSFWIYRESQDIIWAERGKQSISEIKCRADTSEWNFQNKLFLLKAEQCFCNNDFEAAAFFYDKSTASAWEHKFVHEDAIANELAAQFYLRFGQNDRAFQFFTKAHAKYLEWGALSKANVLYECMMNSNGAHPNGIMRSM